MASRIHLGAIACCSWQHARTVDGREVSLEQLTAEATCLCSSAGHHLLTQDRDGDDKPHLSAAPSVLAATKCTRRPGPRRQGPCRTNTPQGGQSTGALDLTCYGR